MCDTPFDDGCETSPSNNTVIDKDDNTGYLYEIKLPDTPPIYSSENNKDNSELVNSIVASTNLQNQSISKSNGNATKLKDTTSSKPSVNQQNNSLPFYESAGQLSKQSSNDN